MAVVPTFTHEPLPARLAQIAPAPSRTASSVRTRSSALLLIPAIVAGEHAVLVWPPTRHGEERARPDVRARLSDARYFEYLLTRFTEPNEIFGPVDIKAFREGRYERRVEGMLPDSEVVFLDEVFKSNSAILNALLTLLNERRFTSGGAVLTCPLLSCFGASNEVPTDETLTAIFDRFLLRIRSENLDAYHFQDLLQRGIANEMQSLGQAPITPLATAREIGELHRAFSQRMRFDEEFLATYKGLVFQIRAEGVSLSVRRVVKLLKLFAASAYLDGRAQPDAGDFFVLKHIWNNEDQATILESIVAPVLEAHFRVHPQARRFGASGVGLEALGGEIDRVRQVLTGGGGLSDVQLFSQLKALNEIKAALGASPDPRAPEMVKRVDQLLEAAFRSGRFAQL